MKSSISFWPIFHDPILQTTHSSKEMEEVKLVEKMVVTPATPTQRRRLFLSNIDLTLVTYLESVTFFEPPPANLTLSDVFSILCDALSRLLVAYNFVAGRLESAKESSRLEIDCNDKGVVVVAATTKSEMGVLGHLRAPKPVYKELVKLVREEEEEETREKPLMSFQLTQFKCGGLVLACRSNHCLFDGVASHEFQANLAALSRGEGLIIDPNPDRMVFSARNPPKISYPHLEYSEITPLNGIFSRQGMPTRAIKQPQLENTCLIHLPPERMAHLKAEAVMDSPPVNCTTFHILAAKIWKARAVAVGLTDDRISTLLFPVDVRKKVIPHAPRGFSGNALVPGFARASMQELKTCQPSFLVKKVHEGLERLDDEYVRSGIDWLQVHKGVPCMVDSFSVVAWWKLGLETACFGWGRVKCLTLVEVMPELVFLLPGEKDEGGIHVCLQLPSEQMKEFYKLMIED